MLKSFLRPRTFAGLVALCAAGGAFAANTCKPTTALGIAQRALDYAEIQNVMSSYSDYYALNDFDHTLALFALNMADVSYHTPMGPTGAAAIRANLMERKKKHEAGQDPVGQLHVHPNSTAMIEVAGDGKTAKGVWDSFGPDVAGADEVGNWLYLRKAVDFIKVDGVWKIWHMQDYPVFNTPYNKSITQSAKEGFNDRRPPPTAAGGAAGAAPGAPGAAGGAGGAGAAPAGGPPPGGAPGGSSVKLQIYDGKNEPIGPKLPEPYCSFDPKGAY
ncbi:MAG: nuclear transport factor 2 family protein [Steroidobacteraceae bacterium]